MRTHTISTTIEGITVSVTGVGLTLLQAKRDAILKITEQGRQITLTRHFSR
jgi:hypothetical protein